MSKPIFSYGQNRFTGDFNLYRRETHLAAFNSLEVSEQFVKWVVDLLNEHYEKFSAERSEKALKEMGF